MFSRLRSGQRKLSQLADVQSNPIQYQELIDSILNLLDFPDMIFTNESLEEIPTKDLFFILIEAYKMQVYQKFTNRSQGTFLALKSANDFLSTCSLFGITPLPNNKSRQDKIMLYKLEKERERLIEELTSKLSEEWEGEDEIMREFALTTIQYYAQLVQNEILLIEEEITLIKYSESLPAVPIDVSRDKSDRIESPLSTISQNTNAPLLSQQGKPLRPFVITSERSRFQKGVFQYDHTLPTMSIETYLQREMERGNFLSGGGSKSGETKDDEDDENDEKTYKARYWDEFKEANPKGWGNTLNKG